jgi:hypothetical protein
MKEGLEWLGGVTNHVERLLTVAALVVGLPAGLALIALGWWAVAVSAGLLAMLVFFEGAFRAWHSLELLGSDFVFSFDDQYSVALKPNFQLCLRVIDHVTGAMIEQSVETRALERGER